MSKTLVSRVRDALEKEVAALGVEPPVAVSFEVPPKPEFGDLACPVAFELARRLKRNPREIASDLKTRLESLPGVARTEVAGGGYLNVFFDRDVFLRELAREVGRPQQDTTSGKRIVEHTNINPNKAAHIGHLRNAVLGDTLVRCMQFTGQRVEVQNYIDDTGVQVADLAVGFLDIRGYDPGTARELIDRLTRGEGWAASARRFVGRGDAGGSLEPFGDECVPGTRLDHYCWDLYAEVAPFYSASEDNAARRAEALHEMEAGRGPYAQVAALVSASMVLHHLRTMARIGVVYDLLPKESDILALRFWERAFERLKETKAIRLATEGKAKGCWVMDLPDAAEAEDEGAKIIVRSNGTVTYVGKDIAYQMWKFGLLGRDFLYRRLDRRELPPDTRERRGLGLYPPESLTVWTTCSEGAESDHPRFGRAERVYNVIDVRQSYLQRVVAQGLRALGHAREAEESIHFSYEMVALTPRSALSLLPDLALSDEERARPYLEMSGRRGIGVKADDLLDHLGDRAARQIEVRRPEIPGEGRDSIAAQIAVGALRYYMLRFTKNRVVAFDVEDSLAFEGETGPYLQYAAVRSRNIFTKLAEREGFSRSRVEEILERARFASLDHADAIEHWQIVREMARLPEIVEQAVSSLELSLLARYVFSVAQRFSAFYHRHPILHEPDPARRDLRIALNELFLRFMDRSLGLMGVPVPDRM